MSRIRAYLVFMSPVFFSRLLCLAFTSFIRDVYVYLNICASWFRSRTNHALGSCTNHLNRCQLLVHDRSAGHSYTYSPCQPGQFRWCSVYKPHIRRRMYRSCSDPLERWRSVHTKNKYTCIHMLTCGTLLQELGGTCVRNGEIQWCIHHYLFDKSRRGIIITYHIQRTQLFLATSCNLRSSNGSTIGNGKLMPEH